MNPYSAGPALDKINIPSDLREKFRAEDLEQVCDELRQYIIDVVSEKGGHFGASLGVVELTVALHYTFNTPYDNIVWDVGHQAYGHKILTGRRDRFHTNRIFKGISGFPKRSESEYDTFGVGHSSTSVSAALGMAVGSKLTDKEKQHVAVIGDGSMTAGLAFEGLNHGGVEDTNMLVVLNDNCMSIDPGVGALKEYLTDITTSHTYNRVKDEVWNLLGQVSKFGPNAQAIVQKVENAIKSAVLKQSNLFESLNFRYFGPVDGHDVEYLTKVLNDLKDIKGPKLLHVVTRKGAGYEPAEQGSATKWHAPGLFDKETGAPIATKTEEGPQPPKFQDVFGKTIIELAKKDKRIVGVTPAMLTGSSLGMMMEEIPERTFDVGIAEQHAVTFSAGMATEGVIPFCNIYSSFMQRAYDQVVHDVALQNLHVVFCLDRGGLVGADGPTHHGVFDLAYMRCIPNMVVAAPMDEVELRNMMYSASQTQTSPYSIRYPRGTGSIANWIQPFEAIKTGRGRKINSGEDIAILSIGAIGTEAKKAVESLSKRGVSAAHYDMRFVKPLDEVMLHEVFGKFDQVITVEDGCIQGGFGSAVLEWVSENEYKATVKRLGIPDSWIEHGTQAELYKACGYDADAITETALNLAANAQGKSQTKTA